MRPPPQVLRLPQQLVILPHKFFDGFKVLRPTIRGESLICFKATSPVGLPQGVFLRMPHGIMAVSNNISRMLHVSFKVEAKALPCPFNRMGTPTPIISDCLMRSFSGIFSVFQEGSRKSL